MNFDTESNLIGQIYEAGLGSQSWRSVLDALQHLLDVGLVTLVSRDHAVAPGYALLGVSGGPESEFRPWGEYYGARDPRKIHIDAVAVGSVYTDFAAMPDSLYERSEIYMDFFRPWGIGKACGVTLIRDATRECNLAVRLPIGKQFADTQVEAMRRLAPHFTRAFRVQRQRALAEAEAARRMLDRTPAAVFVLNRRASVLHMSPRAAALLHRRADALALAGRDVLSVVQPGSQSLFMRALSQALAVQDGEPPPPIFRIEGPAGPLSVMIAPASGYFPATDAAGAACVFIADPGQKPTIDRVLLAQEFGLTPAEAQVVIALAGGASVKQIAADRNVSANTVLIQIKHVLAKTSTRSQSQLVSAVLRGLAATAPV